MDACGWFSTPGLFTRNSLALLLIGGRVKLGAQLLSLPSCNSQSPSSLVLCEDSVYACVLHHIS